MKHLRAASIVVFVSIALVAQLAGSAGADPAPGGAPAGGSTRDRLMQLASRVDARGAATSGPSAAPDASADPAVLAAGGLAVRDPSGDSAFLNLPGYDLIGTALEVTYARTTVSFYVNGALDPRTDSGWTAGFAGVGAALSLDGGTTTRAVAAMGNDGDGHLFAGVIVPSSQTFLCAATAKVASPTVWQISFPTTCFESPGTTAPVAWDAVLTYDNGSSAATADLAPDSGPAGAVSPAPIGTPDDGGYVLDGWGGLHPFAIGGGNPAGSLWVSPYFPGNDIARGVTATDGGLIVLDGFGGVHPAASGYQGGPIKPVGEPAWPGWDIARGIAATTNGYGGYVLDGWGGTHPFSLSDLSIPAASQGPYWPGWDIARGIATTADGTGGYILDGWGALHPFAIGSNPLPPPVHGGPYWPGWDIARGVTILPNGTGGYIVDGWGALHPFAIGNNALPPPAQGGPYWPGWSIARGAATVTGVPGPLALPAS